MDERRISYPAPGAAEKTKREEKFASKEFTREEAIDIANEFLEMARVTATQGFGFPQNEFIKKHPWAEIYLTSNNVLDVAKTDGVEVVLDEARMSELNRDGMEPTFSFRFVAPRGITVPHIKPFYLPGKRNQ